ncbi:MAG: exonuclease domain-containing protein [Thermoleophilia bacterium]
MPSAVQLRLPLPEPSAEAGDALSDGLCALIARRGRPLEVGHVAAQLLRLRRCPERLQRRMVAEIVDRDARLAWLGRDLVGLAPPHWRAGGLASATFCVVDLETTGGAAGYSKVTEIGAVRLREGRVADRFVTLVDPERPIPPAVTELTGIDDATVAGAPRIDRALADFARFAGDDVLVAHNAPFDLRFLNHERRRVAGRYFTQPWLDTLVLARRLLAGRVARHDLGTLADWAGSPVRPVHRALPDAEATAGVLVALLDLLAERDVDSLERAVAFGAGGGARHAFKLALADDLPALPGVYVMRDRRRQALYVGKAADLRRRVRSYFGPGGRHSRLIGRALDRLESIDHEVCGSEFAALLRENELIKRLAPPCNGRGLGGGGSHLRISVGELAPRLHAVRDAPADGARYHGPVRSDRLARQAADDLHAVYRLQPGDPASRAALDEVSGLLDGEPAALGRFGVRLGEALREGALPLRSQDGEGAAAAVLGVLGALARVRRAARRTAVIVEAAGAPGAAELFFVAGGLVRRRARVTAGDWAPAARAGLAAVRWAERRPARLSPAELDEAVIVATRLHDGGAAGSAGAALPLSPGWRSADALAWIGSAVAGVCSG